MLIIEVQCPFKLCVKVHMYFINLFKVVYIFKNKIKSTSYKTNESTDNMSQVMRKPAFSICENKGADQLCGNHAADQCLCFCYIDITLLLLPKFEISIL